jgi:hypothetical protein
MSWFLFSRAGLVQWGWRKTTTFLSHHECLLFARLHWHLIMVLIIAQSVHQGSSWDHALDCAGTRTSQGITVVHGVVWFRPPQTGYHSGLLSHIQVHLPNMTLNPPLSFEQGTRMASVHKELFVSLCMRLINARGLIIQIRGYLRTSSNHTGSGVIKHVHAQG